MASGRGSGRGRDRHKGKSDRGRGDRNKGKKGKDQKPKPIAPTKITQLDFDFVFDGSVSAYDPGTDKAVYRYLREVRGVIEEYVDTNLPARYTPAYTINQIEDGEEPPVGSLFLLTGQPDEDDVSDWVPTRYEVGDKVKYLGETYVAVAETDEEPPVTIERGHLWGRVFSKRLPPGVKKDEGNPNWALAGSDSQTSRAVVNPNFGWVNNKWQTGTPGETWLISVHRGGRRIRFADKKGQKKAFRPNTDYFIESISVADADGNIGDAVVFPRGVTFTTDATLSGLYKASEPAPMNISIPARAPSLPSAITGRRPPRRQRNKDKDKKKPKPEKNKVVWAQVRVSTVPSTIGSMASNQNGIYKYTGPDTQLQRLNAGDGWNGAPDTYEFILVSEFNGPTSPGSRPPTNDYVPGPANEFATSANCGPSFEDGSPKIINRLWISDDYNEWSEAEPGVLVGKNYGPQDISCVNWRGKDAVAGDQPFEWDPANLYYPNDLVAFKNAVFRFISTDQLGTKGVSPADDESWEQLQPLNDDFSVRYVQGATSEERIAVEATGLQPPGVNFMSYADGHRINATVVDLLESEVRSSALVVPKKPVNIFTKAPVQPALSIYVEGDYKTVYAANSTATSIFTSYVYNSSSPVSFSLGAYNVEVFKIRWDLGDGSTSTELSPVHTYKVGSTSPTPFTISVVVTDTKGRFYRASRTINLQRNDPALLGIPVVVD